MTKQKLINYVAWILPAALLVFFTACGSVDTLPGETTSYWEQSNNDSSSQADVMALNYSPAADGVDYTGGISATDRSDDWYRLTTVQSGQLAVTLRCADLAAAERLEFRLYDAAQNELDSSYLNGNTGDSLTLYSAIDETPGEFYVSVNSNSWSHSYDLTPAFTAGSNGNDYWETENNNHSGQADDMPFTYDAGADGYSFTGSISAADSSEDWYRLTTSQPGQVAVTLVCSDLGLAERLDLQLYNSATTELDSASLHGSPGGSVSASTGNAVSAGTYYARISSDSWTHAYDLAVSFENSNASATYWEIEDNDNSSQADQLSLSYSPASDGYDFTGGILAADTSEDWYRLTTTRSGQLSVTISCNDLGAGEQLAIRLYDSVLNTLDSSEVNGAPGGSSTAYTPTMAAAGVYYLKVSSNTWTHQYDLAPGFSW